LSNAQKVARVEAAKEMLKILQKSETNDFNGMATGDESWFQHTMASSKMFARSAADVGPRTGQAVGANTTMITVYFTAMKLTVLDVLPTGSTFNQLYFIKDIFPDLKTANLNCRPRRQGQLFGCTWISPYAITDQTSRQKLRRITFPECRAHPIHQI
jgi:hypothetical protein